MRLAEGESLKSLSQITSSRFSWPLWKSKKRRRDFDIYILHTYPQLESVIYLKEKLPASVENSFLARNLLARVRFKSLKKTFLVHFFPPSYAGDLLIISLTNFGFAPCIKVTNLQSGISWKACYKLALFPPGNVDSIILPDGTRITFQLRSGKPVDFYNPEFIITTPDSENPVELSLFSPIKVNKQWTITLYQTLPWVTLTFIRDTGIIVFFLAFLLSVGMGFISAMIYFISPPLFLKIIVMRENDITKIYMGGKNAAIKKISLIFTG